MSSQRVLVIAEDPDLLTRLAGCVERGGGVPVAVRGIAALSEAQVPHRLVILAWDGGREVLRALQPKLRRSAQLVGVVPQKSLAEQMQLLGEPHLHHLLTPDERGLSFLQVIVTKFVSGDLFGIEKHLPAGTDISLVRLRDYRGRQRAIEQVLEYAESVGVRRQVKAAIAQVCEELLMNALYDAPVDDKGAPLFAEVDPKLRLDRPSPRPVSLRYASSDGQFVIAVRDRFGRLDKPTVLSYIEKCLHQGAQIDRKAYGAGLGLYLIANAASQYIANIAPGMATEIICTFDQGARQPLRALSMFVYPGGAPSTQPGEG